MIFYWDLSFKDSQFRAFRQQLDWSLEFQLPISIHSRNATDECLAEVAAKPGLRGVFHCFSGTAEQAKKIVDLGFYLGIGGVLTFKNAGLDLALKDIPLEHLVLETDAPYLAPMPFRGKRNEPAYLRYVVEKLATTLAMDVQQVAEVTTRNAEQLFKIGE